jgi:hypothetical protein
MLYTVPGKSGLSFDALSAAFLFPTATAPFPEHVRAETAHRDSRVWLVYAWLAALGFAGSAAQEDEGVRPLGVGFPVWF